MSAPYPAMMAARIARLTARYGLSHHRAALLAALIWGSDHE